MPSLTMPNVGEGVTEGTVVRWMKHEGDAVRRDEPLVQVETDKAVVDIPSPFEGRLVRILVAENQAVPIGTPLAEFEGGDGSGTDGARQEQPAAAGAPAPTAIPAPPASPPPAPAAVTERPAPDGVRRSRQYSPVVLKLAEEHGVDLEQIKGTGLDGRVTRRDVLRYIEERPAPPAQPAPTEETKEQAVAETTEQMTEALGEVAPSLGEASAEEAIAPAAAAAQAATGRTEHVPLSAIRRTIAARMTEAHQTIPVAWMVVEADVTAIVRLRERLKDEFRQREGVNLTYLPFFVGAIIAALKENPRLNATYSDDGITVHHQYNIGIAVAADAGLMVPVIRDADRLSIDGLAREIAALADKARERRLTLDELQGGTFTINNTGAFGSLVSQPIVVPGQVAIITTEAIRRELRVDDDGSFAVRSVMNLCISFDHRALDGAEVGAFMRTVKERLEGFREDRTVYWYEGVR